MVITAFACCFVWDPERKLDRVRDGMQLVDESYHYVWLKNLPPLPEDHPALHWCGHYDQPDRQGQGGDEQNVQTTKAVWDTGVLLPHATTSQLKGRWCTMC